MELIESVTSDSVERRRMQNRAAQRKFRQKRNQKRAAEKALEENNAKRLSIPPSVNHNPQGDSFSWSWMYADLPQPSNLTHAAQRTCMSPTTPTSYLQSLELDHGDSLINIPPRIQETNPIWNLEPDEMFLSSIGSTSTSPMSSLGGSTSPCGQSLISSRTDQPPTTNPIRSSICSHACGSVPTSLSEDSDTARRESNRSSRSSSYLLSPGLSQAHRMSLASGTPISATENGWLSTMHIAAQKGRDRIVRILLQQGIPFDEKDEDGRTPLVLAVVEGHVQVVATLLKHGAKVNVFDHEGRSALHWAAIKCNEPILNLLLENAPSSLGFNIDTYDNMGWTPLHLAVDRGFEAGVMLLLQCGANINFKARRCPDSGNVIPMDHSS